MHSNKFSMAASSSSLLTLVLFSLVLINCLSVTAQSTVYDYSYMTSVRNATDMPLIAHYDYIVIGGGTAGCPLAATLSANYSVLVLERGGVPLEYPDVLRAAAYYSVLQQAEVDGTTPAQRFTSEEGVENWRGRILGGTSMINGGFYSRAEPEFYPLSGINWEMSVVEESFRWVEETVAFRKDLFPWSIVAKEGLLQANVTPDNNYTVEHLIGTKEAASTFNAPTPARRFGAVEFLNKANLTNLRVAVRASVDKIILSPSLSGLVATGVRYKDSAGRTHTAFVRSRGEVILSAGPMGSPQLLLLSGVGPFSTLLSLGILPLHNLPSVGKFVYDNAFTYVTFSSPIPLTTSVLQIVGILPNFSYIEACSFVNAGSFFGKVGRILSLGTYSLQSTDVRVPPKVRYNYYSDPLDLARCVNGVRKIFDVLNTTALDQFKFVNNATGEREFRFVEPAPPLSGSDAAVGAFCRSAVNSTSHYHGGCVAGKVVDGELRVKGTRGLRVVDASVFDSAPGTNPQATTMMMGRYIGTQMLKQRMAA